MSSSRPYQVCLYVGTKQPTIDDVKVVNLTPTELTADAITVVLQSSGLSPSDLRSKVVFMADPGADAVREAIAVYAALCGYAGRRVDITVGDDVLDAAALDAKLRTLADAGKPESAIDHVQFGVAHDVLPSVLPGAGLSDAQVGLLRFARRVRFVPVNDVLGALTQFIAIAAIRARGDQDRFPYLVEGNEPVVEPDATSDIVGVCLDELRRAASDVRRHQRFDNREALAEHEDLDERRRRLLAASAQPIEEVMARLGASLDEEHDLWHCPRPDRHSNGDANASMRIQRGKVRCYRCDAERVDSLRLVMDTLDLTPDEAADWLLATPQPATV